MLKQALLLFSAVAVIVNGLGDTRAYGTKTAHGKKSTHKFTAVHPAVAPEKPTTYAQHGYPAMVAPPAVPPSPYSFGYEADGSAREESRDDSGKVTGSYSLVNEDGSKRVVKYIADEQGFRAFIDTDEPGTKSDNPANIELKSSAKVPVHDDSSAYQQPKPATKYSSVQQKKYQPPIAPQKPSGFVAIKEESAVIPPYAFSFDSQLDDGSNARSESSDGSGKVVGSYSLSTSEGSQRKVDYSADQSGFHASIDTNEFGTKSESPANVKFISSAPQEVPITEQKQTAIHFRPGQSKFEQKTTSYQIQEPHVQEEYPPSPYEFNYNAELEDGSIYRSESSDGSGKVIGSYKLSVADGRHRNVEYTADHNGFRATVNTNEFGTKADSPADVMFYSTATEEEPAPYISPSALRHGQRNQDSKVHYQQQQPIPSGPVHQEAVPYPYAFNYENQMQSGMSSHSEKADASGKVTGTYSLAHSDGSQRKVEYTADDSGFKAVVQTNEFGTKSDSPADVVFQSTLPQETPAVQKVHSSPKSSRPAAHTGFVRNEQKMIQQEFPRNPYSFNYEADGSSRQESSDDQGKVMGTYTVMNEDGSQRIVEYIADEMGFRAKVKTDEPGTKSDNPADVSLHSSAKEIIPSAPAQVHNKPKFPARTHTQKTSMISQETIY